MPLNQQLGSGLRPNGVYIPPCASVVETGARFAVAARSRGGDCVAMLSANAHIEHQLFAMTWCFPHGKLDSQTADKEILTGRGYKVPNGALFTTVADLAHFELFEMLGGSDSVLPGKEIENNRHNLVCTDAAMAVGHGIGFATQRVAGHLLLGHAGGVIGYTAMAFFNPGSQLGLILLRNETAFGNEKVLQAFAEKLPDEKPKPE